MTSWKKSIVEGNAAAPGASSVGRLRKEVINEESNECRGFRRTLCGR